MLAANTSHNVLQICWVVTRHEKKKPRHFVSPETHKVVYEFWLQQENAIMSTDRRSGRDELRICKLEYLRLYPLYEHQWNKNNRKGVCAEKYRNKEEIHGSPVNVLYSASEKIYHDFVETGFAYSIGSIIKYKSFYITAPTEREKESCLCKNCLNTHLPLAGINNFWRAQKLLLHAPVTDFLNDQTLHGHSDTSEVSFCFFEKKEEIYFKNGIEIVTNLSPILIKR